MLSLFAVMGERHMTSVEILLSASINSALTSLVVVVRFKYTKERISETTPKMKPILYTFWRSSCAWRVRIGAALNEEALLSRTVNLFPSHGVEVGRLRAVLCQSGGTRSKKARLQRAQPDRHGADAYC